MSLQSKDTTEELRSVMRREIRRSATTNLQLSDVEPRMRLRYSRVIPALVMPVHDQAPSFQRATCLISRDLSDHGISLVDDQPLPFEIMIVGLWYDNRRGPSYEQDGPTFVLGKNCASNSIGGGFWQTGVEFQSLYTNAEYLGDLQDMAKTLRPLSDHAEVGFELTST